MLLAADGQLSLHAGGIFSNFLPSADFFQNESFQKNLSGFKQFGPRSGSTLCHYARPVLGSNFL